MNSPAFLQESAERTAKYAHLTEGLAKGYETAVVEQLLANMDHVLATKRESPVTTGAVTAFTTLAKPLIRRVWSAMIAPQLVSVQPIPMPTYKVFFLDHTFGDSNSPTVAGDRLDYAALKQNPYYSTGRITDQAIGTGDGTDVTFNTGLYPIVAGSLVVKVGGTPVAVTSVNTDTGAIVLSGAPANLAAVTATYNLVMEGLGAAGNATIPSLKFQMSSASVEAISRKLMASHTLETGQDFEAYFGLSAQSELADLLQREVAFETDRYIIAELLAGASAGNVNWDDAVPANVLAKDHYETLVHAILDADNKIYKKRLVRATWVVMGPDAATILAKTSTFRAAGNGEMRTITGGPNVMGTLASQFSVIVDPLFPADKILVGHKGTNWNETGYVYGPYTMFESGVFVDPKDMIPRQGLASRGAHHLVSGDFYATVTIT